MRFVVLIVLFSFLTQLMAAERALADGGLTDEQVLSRYQAEHRDSIAASVRTEVSEWAKLGANISEVVVATAKGLGVAAAEFASTPLGILLVTYLVFKLVGAKLLACVVIFCLATLSVWYYKRTIRDLTERKYETTPVLWGLFSRTRLVSSKPVDTYSSGSARETALGIMCIACAISTVAICAILCDI